MTMEFLEVAVLESRCDAFWESIEEIADELDSTEYRLMEDREDGTVHLLYESN